MKQTFYHVGDLSNGVRVGEQGLHCSADLADAEQIQQYFCQHPIPRKPIHDIYEVSVDDANLMEIPGDLPFWGSGDLDKFLQGNHPLFCGYTEDEMDEIWEEFNPNLPYSGVEYSWEEGDEAITAKVVKALLSLGIDGFKYRNYHEGPEWSYVFYNIEKVAAKLYKKEERK